MTMVQLCNWPMRNPTITQLFGANPKLYVKYGYPGHNGLDIVSADTEILSAAPGIAVIAGFNKDGYGNLVKLDHGAWFSYYAHASEIHVKPNQMIEAGQSLGVMGWTGDTWDTNNQHTPASAHLHFEIRIPGHGAPGFANGDVDPLPLLRAIQQTAQLTAQPAAQVLNIKAQVVVDTLNIRQGPGVSFDKTGEYKGGDPISILDIAGDSIWLKTDRGYIAGRFNGEDYIKVTE